MSINWLKRIATFTAAALLLTSLTACSGGEESGSGTAEGTAEATQEAQTAVKLGFIYNGSAEGTGFSADCNRQRLASEEYTNVESEYIDNVNVGDFEKAVKMLVEDGCTHIVSGSPVFSHAINPVSQNYMNINFIDYGSSMRSTNIYAYTESVYQAAYIAGMVAAYNSESEKIGIVADPSMLYTVQVTDAAQLGAQIVYSTATTVYAAAREASEIRSAVDALVRKGCDVVISYTASAETVDYCESKGVKVIGCLDYRDTAENYKNLLMYFYSSRDSFYLAQYKAMEQDSWQPESYLGTVGNGVLKISDALSGAKDGTQDIMDALIPKVASGSAYIFSGQLKDVNGSIMQREDVSMSTSDILALSWYVEGVDLSLDTFVVSKDAPTEHELVIKK